MDLLYNIMYFWSVICKISAETNNQADPKLTLRVIQSLQVAKKLENSGWNKSVKAKALKLVC